MEFDHIVINTKYKIEAMRPDITLLGIEIVVQRPLQPTAADESGKVYIEFTVSTNNSGDSKQGSFCGEAESGLAASFDHYQAEARRIMAPQYHSAR